MIKYFLSHSSSRRNLGFFEPDKRSLRSFSSLSFMHLTENSSSGRSIDPSALRQQLESDVPTRLSSWQGISLPVFIQKDSVLPRLGMEAVQDFLTARGLSQLAGLFSGRPGLKNCLSVIFSFLQWKRQSIVVLLQQASSKTFFESLTGDVFQRIIEIPLRSPAQIDRMLGVWLIDVKVIEQPFVDRWFRSGLIVLFSRKVLADSNALDAAFRRVLRFGAATLSRGAANFNGVGSFFTVKSGLELMDFIFPTFGEGSSGVGEGMVNLFADTAGRTIGSASPDLGGTLQNLDLLNIKVSAIPFDGGGFKESRLFLGLRSHQVILEHHALKLLRAQTKNRETWDQSR